MDQNEEEKKDAPGIEPTDDQNDEIDLDGIDLMMAGEPVVNPPVAETPAVDTIASNNLTALAFSHDEFLRSFENGQNPDTAKSLPATPIRNYIDKFEYGKIENYILMHIDHVDGVKSSVVVDSDRFPTGVGYVRDARLSAKETDRTSPDDPILLADNLLLRVLGTVRGMDHALKHKHKQNPDKAVYADARVQLQKLYQVFLTDVTNNPGGNLKKLQEDINTHLIQILHTAGLDVGIRKDEKYANLLSYYRGMAALLDTAKSMVTVVSEVRNDITGTPFTITQTDTSHPITVKTDKQKAQLQIMQTVQLDVPKEKQNFHTAKIAAFQEVNAAFADLVVRDDRRLDAQARKFIGPSLDNAYRVENLIEFKNNETNETSTSNLVSLRSGSLGYIGKDDSDENVRDYAQQKLLQLQNAVAGKKLHVTMLLTDSSRSGQDIMVAAAKNACAALGHHYSYIPTNTFGLAETPKLDEIVKTGDWREIETTDFLTGKAARIAKVAKVIMNACSIGNVVNVTTCASGMDRSGTAQEVATQAWALQQYQQKDFALNRQQIEKVRVTGRNAAFIGCVATPGSDGMKNDSKPAKYFQAATNEQFYRSTAKTNKIPPINLVAVGELVKQWKGKLSNLVKPVKAKKITLEETFQDSQNKIQSAKNPAIVIESLLQWANQASQQQPKSSSNWLSSFFQTRPAEQNKVETNTGLIIDYVIKNIANQNDLPNFIKQVQDKITQQKSLLDRREGSPALKQLESLIRTADDRLKISSSTEEVKSPRPNQ
jgi:hypothetical protein